MRDAVLARYPAASEDDLVRIEALVAAWHASPLARELAASEASRPELGFAFAHDGVLVHGRFDLLRVEDGRALVVDYKTNRLEETTPEESVEHEYRLQRLVYALAAFGAGADEVEVAYVFLERPDEPVRATFARADVPELEAELSAAIAAIQENDFRPTPSEFACAGCPALDVVCAGTEAAPPDVFSRSAHLYDAVYSFKDYAAEEERLRRSSTRACRRRADAARRRLRHRACTSPSSAAGTRSRASTSTRSCSRSRASGCPASRSTRAT